MTTFSFYCPCSMTAKENWGLDVLLLTFSSSSSFSSFLSSSFFLSISKKACKFPYNGNPDSAHEFPRQSRPSAEGALALPGPRPPTTTARSFPNQVRVDHGNTTIETNGPFDL